MIVISYATNILKYYFKFYLSRSFTRLVIQTLFTYYKGIKNGTIVQDFLI